MIQSMQCNMDQSRCMCGIGEAPSMKESSGSSVKVQVQVQSIRMECKSTSRSTIYVKIIRIKGPRPTLPRVSYSDQYGSTECKAEAWICKKFSWWMISCIFRLTIPVVHKSILFEFLAYIDNLISLLCLCKTICIPLLGRVLV